MKINYLLKSVVFLFIINSTVFSEDHQKSDKESGLILSSKEKVTLHSIFFEIYYTMLADDSPFNGTSGNPKDRQDYLMVIKSRLDELSDTGDTQKAKKMCNELIIYSNNILRASVTSGNDAGKIYSELGFPDGVPDPDEISINLYNRMEEFARICGVPSWIWHDKVTKGQTNK